jgi:glycine C-acetyltransferase
MLGEGRVAQDLAAALLDEGVLVSGFSFPVVPRGQARVRTQVSAAHSPEQIQAAVAAFQRARQTIGACA